MEVAHRRLKVLKAEAEAGNHDPWVHTDNMYMRTDLNIDKIVRAQVMMAACGGRELGSLHVLTAPILRILFKIPNPRGGGEVHYKPQPHYDVPSSKELAGDILGAMCDDESSDATVQDLDSDAEV